MLKIMQGTTPTHVTLAKIHQWIRKDGLKTDSAALLRQILLSLAGHGSVNLMSYRMLDTTRRAWLADLIRGLHHVSAEELISAAGGLDDPHTS